MIYGYARVSTDAQDLSNQVAQLKATGCATIFRSPEATRADRPPESVASRRAGCSVHGHRRGVARTDQTPA
jgi:hypothetical protein